MKKILAAILAAASLMTATMSVSAITKSDKPITGGNTVFTQKEILYTGEADAPTKWCNAFCNEDWTGCRWTAETVDGKQVAKIVPVAGKSANYMDFNYYQWNNDKYYPSLAGKDYKFLAVRYKLNDAAMKTAGDSTFWASKDSPELSKTIGAGTVSFKMTAKANEWTTDIIALDSIKFGDSSAWSDSSVRQFRYYPFGKAKADEGAVCYIEWMAFFKTEAEAKAYTGPKAASATKPTAAATADPIALVVLAAAASAGLAVVAGKRK